MISIVIPVYNKEKTVARALKSVLNQTYQDFEIVVVDDGSTDGSVAEVRRFSDSRIRLIEQTNEGVSAARNRGVSKANADWVAFLDSDDEWLPGFLAAVIGLRALFPECEVAASTYFMQASNGVRRLPALSRESRDREFVFNDYFAAACRSDPPIHSSAVAVKKSALRRIGGFPIGIAAGEDLLTWARLACGGTIAYTGQPLAIFHQDPRCSDGRPSRRPDDRDAVGKYLKDLPNARPDVARSIKCYIGMWYKMRASIYLRLGDRRNSIKAATQALRYLPYEKRLYLYLAAMALPLPLTLWVFNKVRRT